MNGGPSIPLLDPVDTDKGTDCLSPMVHFSDPPYTHALCGFEFVSGKDFVADEAEVECIVCFQLEKAGL